MRLAKLPGWLLILAAACLAAAPAVVRAQTLERIAATKTVRIGYVADQAPFATAGANGDPVGYSIDLCNHIVEAVEKRVEGVKPVYVQTRLADGFPAVAAGQIDLLCGAITATLARRETVDFSQPIFVTGMSALLRSDASRNLRELFFGEREISPPRSPELTPFSVARIGVRSDTTTEAVLQKAVDEGGYKATIVAFATHAEGLSAIEARDIDAYFADRGLLLGLLAKARHPSALVLGIRVLSREPYAIALQRGDADFRLLVDRTLSDFYQTTQFSALLSRHFAAEAPSLAAQIVALSLPD